MPSRLLLTMAFLALALLVLVACEAPEESRDTATPVNDPPSIRDRVLQKMADSPYAMTITSSPGSDLNGEQWRVQYEGAKRYSLTWSHKSQTSSDACQGMTVTNGETKVCYPTSDPSAPTQISESVWADGNLYRRDCREDTTCGKWTVLAGSQPYRPATGIGAAPYPESPIEALRSAYHLQWLGTDELEGTEAGHVRGQYNPMKALLQLEADVLGPQPSGAECTGPIRPSASDSAGQIECHALQYEGEVQHYEDQPATIDMWSSPDDSRILRLTMTVPRSRIFALGMLPIVPEIMLDYTYSYSETNVAVPDVGH